MFRSSRQRLFAQEEQAATELAGWVADSLMEEDGRVRAENFIATMATILAERCIEAAGDYNPRMHSFVPGQRIFSDKINELLTGDTDEDWFGFPKGSVCAILRDMLLSSGFDPLDLVPMPEIFSAFAARVGDPDDWGNVPLSLPDENRPDILPIRVGYETREGVDEIFERFGNDRLRRLRSATMALGIALQWTHGSIDAPVAIKLALEIVNGMAKTAPMTDKAMEQVMRDELAKL